MKNSKWRNKHFCLCLPLNVIISIHGNYNKVTASPFMTRGIWHVRSRAVNLREGVVTWTSLVLAWFTELALKRSLCMNGNQNIAILRVFVWSFFIFRYLLIERMSNVIWNKKISFSLVAFLRELCLHQCLVTFRFKG
jgi:hypothetical protein